jgi:hypothetical protein
MTRGPKIKNEVRRLIISEAIHESKNMPRRALAVRLQDLIEKMGEISPSEDTLARMISAARNHPLSELDQPWSIGACTRYNIPPESIPVLINIQQFRAHNSRLKEYDLTVREALWFVRLHPIVEPLMKERYPDDPDTELVLLSVIVNQYVQQERVSELMNEQYPNTSDLDNTYFVNKSFSVEDLFDGFWSTLTEKQEQQVADMLEQGRLFIIREFEKAYGRPPTDEEVELINGYVNSAKSGAASLRAWLREHPDMRDVREQGVKVYTAWAKETSKNIKGVETNER